MNQALRWLGWLAGIILLMLVVAEFWAREQFSAENPWPIPLELSLPGNLVENHPQYGYQLKANSSVFFSGPDGEFDVNYQTNEFGLRDSGMFSSGPKQPLVLVLGDAYVEGYGVMRDAAFTLELQRRLRFQKGAKSYPRILNAGTTGFGAYQSMLRGKSLIDELKPDLLIFVYTSLMPVADYRYAEAKNGSLIPPTTSSRPSHESPFRLKRLFDDYLAAKRAQDNFTAGDPSSDILAAARSPEQGASLHAATLKNLDEIARYAKKLGVKFLLLQVPLPHQVAIDEWQTGRQAYALEKKVYDPIELPLLEQWCTNTEQQCILSTTRFRELAAERSSRIYFPTSYVPTEAGHLALVELLIDPVRHALGIALPR